MSEELPTQERTDEDVVRRELARQQYALGGDDEPTAEALAALDRLLARLKGSEELHKLRANAERMMEERIEGLRGALERIATVDRTYEGGDPGQPLPSDIARAALTAPIPEIPEGAE